MMSFGARAAFAILGVALLVLITPRAWACREAHPAAKEMAGWATACANPLCGTIYATQSPGPLRDPAAAPSSCGPVADQLNALAHATAKGVLILGEAHDNPAHHAVRAHMLTGAAVVIEQAARDRQPALDQWRAQALKFPPPDGLAALKEALAWDASGWKKYPYEPLLNALSQSRLTVVAGDVPRPEIRRAAKEGPAALSDFTRAALKLDRAQDAGLASASAKEIEDSHCGMLPATAIPNMAFAQRLRDATLADATLEAVQRHGSAVLLTGNAHARTDRGVPWYLRQRAPDMPVVSVMLVEVELGKTAAEAYVPRAPNGRPAADYLIFTPPAARGDPCAAFKEQTGGSR